jgi:orotate phosphoribosyltransferase
MKRDSDFYISWYRQKHAYWVHDGNMARPHVCLRSGLHSDGFFNSRPIIDSESIIKLCAKDLVSLFEADGGFGCINTVVGPQTGATKLAELISEEIAVNNKSNCSWASPSRKKVRGNDCMVFKDEEVDYYIKEKMILLCEDVISTGGSLRLVQDAIKQHGGTVLPYVLTLVNRSGKDCIDGRKIFSLVNRHLHTWNEGDCPLCEKGSKVISDTKSEESWERLNASY